MINIDADKHEYVHTRSNRENVVYDRILSGFELMCLRITWRLSGGFCDTRIYILFTIMTMLETLQGELKAQLHDAIF